MTELEQKMIALIQEDLPESTAGVLKEYLETAAQAIENDKKQKQEIDRLRRKSEDKEREISGLNISLRNVTAERDALKTKSDEVDTKERVFDKTILEIKLAAAEGNSTFARDVALGLVRNTEYRRNSLGTAPQYVAKNSDGYADLGGTVPVEDETTESAE